MNWSTIEQVIRIAMYAIGGFFLGEGVTEGEQFTQLVAGAVMVGAGIWWLVFEYNRPK